MRQQNPQFKKNFSFLTSHFSSQRGYTLTEILVSLSVFAIVSGIVLTILVISFRGTKKTETITNIKQNGNSALNQMVKAIRFAKSLDDPVSCNPTVTTSSITFTSLSDAGQTTLSCPSGLSTGITSNSASLVDTTSVTVPKAKCSFTCSQQGPGTPPAITISFTLDSVDSNNFVETTGSIPFQTTVSMWNVNQ